jgi:flagellar biosynthesis/type III secretory pathway chaperone
MAEVLNNLIKALEEEVSLYADLFTLVDKTQQALVNHNLEELAKMLDSQQLLILQAAKLEEKRRQAQDGAVLFLKLSPEELTLTILIEKAPEAFRGKLGELQQSLLYQVDKINQVNRHNEELIKDSLKYIDYTMNLITDGGDEAKTYDQKLGAEKKDQTKSKIFDKRV